MKNSLDSAFELRLINRIRTLQYETIDFLRRGTSDEAVYQKYTKYLNIYATNVNASNKNIVYNNFDSLASFFRARLASCRQTWSDSLMAKEMNEAFTAYKKAVSEGTCPAEEHTFKMDETIIDKLY